MPDALFAGAVSLPFQYGGFVNEANNCRNKAANVRIVILMNTAKSDRNVMKKV